MSSDKDFNIVTCASMVFLQFFRSPVAVVSYLIEQEQIILTALVFLVGFIMTFLITVYSSVVSDIPVFYVLLTTLIAFGYVALAISVQYYAQVSIVSVFSGGGRFGPLRAWTNDSRTICGVSMIFSMILGSIYLVLRGTGALVAHIFNAPPSYMENTTNLSAFILICWLNFFIAGTYATLKTWSLARSLAVMIAAQVSGLFTWAVVSHTISAIIFFFSTFARAL